MPFLISCLDLLFFFNEFLIKWVPGKVLTLFIQLLVLIKKVLLVDINLYALSNVSSDHTLALHGLILDTCFS